MSQQPFAARRPLPRAAARISLSPETPRRLATLLLAAGGCAVAHAQQAASPQQLPPVVVSAATFSQPLSQALPSTSVITRRQIVNSGASNLTTLLQRIAGVQLTFNGGPGQTSTTYVRGFGSTDLGVLVLLDGVPLTAQDTSGSAGYLQNLGTDQIQRIEIVRGNVSAIYGSGAIGGVILITTREGGAAPHASVSAMAGSQGTASLSADAGGTYGRTRVQAGWSRYTTQGIASVNPAQDPYVSGDARDGYRNSTQNASIQQQLAPGQRVGLRAFRSDGQYTYSNTAGAGQTVQQLYQLYSDNRIASDWTSHLSVSQQTVDNANSYGGLYSGGARTRVQMLQWRNVLRLDPHWTLTGGAQWQHQAIETDGPGSFANLSRDARAVFAGINGVFGANQLQFNLRHDSVGGLSSQNTGYLGYARRLGGGFKALASYSTAFNAPPLGYLYANIPSYGLEANPQLKPEQAHSAEAGLQWHSATTLLRATLFDTRMTDEWVYATDPSNFLSQFRNVASSRTRGLEFSGSSSWRDWMLDGNLTLQQPVDLSQPGHPTLQRRARSLANLELSRRLRGVLLGASLHYSGPRPDVDYSGATAVPVSLGSYTTLDLSAGGSLDPHWSWKLYVRNVLDKAYQTAYGYNRAPLGVFFGLTWLPTGS